MNRNKKLTVAAAALTGLLAGSASRLMAAVAPTSGHDSSSKILAGHQASTLDDTPAKHDCKGKNACKGQGGCKTSDNGCKGKNSCKGNGGCKSSDDAPAPTPAPAPEPKAL